MFLIEQSVQGFTIRNMKSRKEPSLQNLLPLSRLRSQKLALAKQDSDRKNRSVKIGGFVDDQHAITDGHHQVGIRKASDEEDKQEHYYGDNIGDIDETRQSMSIGQSMY